MLKKIRLPSILFFAVASQQHNDKRVGWQACIVLSYYFVESNLIFCLNS